ncbi:Tetratricopeptide TPR_1 repeat-containing protein [Solidesulfovibrio carbinoliphilus subsp. oakridgensis]|uniref:Tetratricopeptide TPR_1 repeat-containing protein n=1 Tax=Solidesulfovibrio carbinoliphilus subsp. oakridgensis TaxID=694327 RepID=G7QDL1_9BACT|nr:tetratricopeptide repeat protein [Solidesulfovibrio carbinoliphilus]EHJ46517.1 Tetratricopeptide TPR_1 repeat-containing protein [Solidesulfovibrio carbinoliphilus subsp. oakridgensis]
MKNKQYDDDVREFIALQNGIFLVVSNDALFNKNLRGTLLRHLTIKDECVTNVFTIETLHKEIKLQRSKGHKLLIFIERELNGRNTSDLIRYLKTDYNNELFVVVLTTEVERDKLVLLHELGADNIITKPISPDTLIEKIAFTVKPRGQIGELMDKGRQFLDTGNPLEAARTAKQVLEMKPNSPSGLLLMGDALRGMGKREEALRAYTQAEKGARLFLDPLKKIASLHHEEGNTAEEIKFLERLDKLSPLNVDRKVDIGTGYIKLGDVDKAKAAFDQAVRIATKEALDAVSRVTQSIAARCMESAPELSEQYLRQTLNTRKNMLDRSDIETFNRLGLMLRRQGKWQEAIIEYRKALKISPDDGGLFYNIAMAFTEGRQYIEAYQYLDRSLTLNPDLWRTGEAVCYNIATVFRRYGKKDPAIDYLKKALELNPDYTKAKALLEEIGNGS